MSIHAQSEQTTERQWPMLGRLCSLFLMAILLSSCITAKRKLPPNLVARASMVVVQTNGCYTYVVRGKTYTYCPQPLPPMKINIVWDDFIFTDGFGFKYNIKVAYDITVQSSGQLEDIWSVVAKLAKCFSGQQFVFARSNAVAFYRAKSP